VSWLLIGGPCDGKELDVSDESHPELTVALSPSVAVTWEPMPQARSSIEYGTYKPTSMAEFQRRVMRWHGPREGLT